MRPSLRLNWLIFGWLLIALTAALFAILEVANPDWPVISNYLIFAWQGCGILLLVIAILDAFTLLSSRTIRVTRKVSHNIAVGSSTEVSLILSNDTKRPQTITVNDHYPEHCIMENLPFALNIPSSTNATLTYRLIPSRRGDAVFGKVLLLVGSLLKLWQLRLLRGENTTVKVYPNFAAIHHYILLSADQQSAQMGIRQSQKRGEGLEFHQLREYRLGDSLRQIDWRATSRLKKLISREYQEEKDQNIIFLLDCGRRMRTQDDQLSHFDHSLNAMLLLAYIGLKQGDAVGLLSFGGIQRWLAPRKGTQHINTLLNQVYDCHPTLHASDFITAASELNQRIRKRSLIVLISNCRDEDVIELQPAMRLLNQHHLVMLANLREEALDRVKDSEIVSFQNALEYAETVSYLHHRNRVQEHCREQGVIAIDTQPKHLAAHIVNSYFEIKRSGKL